MRDNRCTVVVSSCDKYEDLWVPFFKIIKHEWPDLKYPIILNTESKQFGMEGLDIGKIQLFNETKMSWTRRLRLVLESIYSDYIIFLLDDFFMQGKIKSEKIEQCIQWMDDNQRISCFCFMETQGRNIDDKKYPGFERRPLIAKYKFNCQAGLWRRKRLIQYLSQDESPWEWEEYGNWRSYRYFNHEFYSYRVGYDYVFPYLYETNGLNWGGLGLYRGKWYLPYVEPLFKKHGINIDFSLRGSISDEEFAPILPKKKEEYHGIMRYLSLLRPIYGRVIPAVYKLKYIKHFF